MLNTSKHRISKTKRDESLATTHALVMAPQLTNLYVVATLATIGGLLQGFDVSSLSAILASQHVRLPRLLSSLFV